MIDDRIVWFRQKKGKIYQKNEVIVTDHIHKEV